jgi:hypothetical protein
VDPAGGRFSTQVPEGFTEDRTGASTSYVVPTKTSDGQVIALGGQSLPQSSVKFHSGNMTISVLARQSYLKDFEQHFEELKRECAETADKIEPRLTKMDGVRAGEIVSVRKRTVTIAVFFKKDGYDHFITAVCPEADLPQHAVAVSRFLKNYHSIAAKN